MSFCSWTHQQCLIQQESLANWEAIFSIIASNGSNGLRVIIMDLCGFHFTKKTLDVSRSNPT